MDPRPLDVAVEAAPRVYLKVGRKRGREGFVEEASQSTHVRVRWDTAAMGAPPALLHHAFAARTNLLFRRLRRAGVSTMPAGGPGPAAPQTQARVVERVTLAGPCVVIECGDVGSSSAATADFFVLDARATEADALVEAFGDFAVTEAAPLPVEASLLKRERDADAAEVPCYFLAPQRRTTRVSDATAAVAAVVESGSSPWGVVGGDADGTMWRLLQEFDENLCVEAAGEATVDLYCYPDHRKDDEYDSNAEDFSGNDYPDDADDPSADSEDQRHAECAADVSTSSTTRRVEHQAASRHAYGMFCEEGYSERSLSSGWGTDD